MPKIPLYAQGAGSVVQTPVGQLGPRASSGAFTAPAQALIGLGQQIGKAGMAYAENKQRFEAQKAKIDFDFAMAEKEAEDRRIVAEEAEAAVVATSSFLEKNQDTDTTTFNENFDSHQKTLLQNLQSKGYTKRRMDLVTNSIKNSIRSQRSTGANNAFDRGQFARKTAADTTIQTAIQQAALYPEMHPERVRLENVIEDTFVSAEKTGLKLSADRLGVQAQMVYQDYNRQLNAVTDETSRLSIIEQMKKDPRINQAKREALLKDANEAKTRIRGENLEFGLKAINTADIPLTETKAVEDAIMSGGVYQFTDAGGNQTAVDFSVFKESDKTSFLTALNRNQKDLEDTVTDNLLFNLSDGFDPAQDTSTNVSMVAEMYSSENMQLHGKTFEQLDDITLDFANQLEESVSNVIASEDVTADNFLELQSQLDSAEAVLNAQLAGRPPLATRGGSEGGTAQGIASSIAKARKNLKDLALESSKVASGSSVFEQGNFYLVADSFTKPETKKIVDAAMAKHADNLPKQLSLLSKNDQTYARFENILSRTSGRITNPDFDPESEEAVDVMAGIELFRNMKLTGNKVVLNHVNEQDRKVFESVLLLEPHFGLASAIRTVQQQRDDIDIESSYKLVKKQVDSIVDEKSAAYSWYEYIPGLGRDEQFTVKDSSAIRSYVERLSKEYIALGIVPEEAVALAARDYGMSHKRVRNIMVPITRNLPDDIEVMATAAVMAAHLQYPEINENYDTQELSIGNIEGSVDRWTLIADGGYPVILNDGRPVEFTMKELEQFSASERADKMLIQEATRADINKTNEIERQFIEGTGPFEGLSPYEKRTLRLRLLSPERSFRITPEEIREKSEELSRMISEIDGAGGA